MNIDQLTDIAFEVASELEPGRSYDVFDVTDSHIYFQDERGLFKVCHVCLNDNSSLAEQIKKQLKGR